MCLARGFGNDQHLPIIQRRGLDHPAIADRNPLDATVVQHMCSAHIQVQQNRLRTQRLRQHRIVVADQKPCQRQHTTQPEQKSSHPGYLNVVRWGKAQPSP